MALNFKGFFNKDDDPDNELENENTEEVEEEGQVKRADNEKTVILLEPRAYSESQQIADYLKARKLHPKFKTQKQIIIMNPVSNTIYKKDIKDIYKIINSKEK